MVFAGSMIPAAAHDPVGTPLARQLLADGVAAAVTSLLVSIPIL
jgi:hypothetical protein